MDSRLPGFSFRPFRPVTLTLCLLGWGGLALVVTLSLPTVWPRWLFFALLFLALSGTALPVVWFLNLRFPSTPPVEASVIVREAMWVGIGGTTLAWLQLGRLASLGVFLGLVAGLTAIEYLLQLRERSRWRPAPSPESPPSNGPSPTPQEPLG